MARPAAVELVSRTLLLVGVVVVKAGEVISRVELRGTAEVVAEVGLVPGTEDIVSAKPVVVAPPIFVTGIATWPPGDVPTRLDWIGVVAEVLRLDLSPVADKIVEVVTCEDVSGQAEETEAGDSDVDCTKEVVASGVVVLDTMVDSLVEVARPAAVEVVSRMVLLLGIVVVKAGKVISRVELRGTAEVVSEVGLVPGAEVDVLATTVVVAVVASVAALVTC